MYEHAKKGGKSRSRVYTCLGERIPRAIQASCDHRVLHRRIKHSFEHAAATVTFDNESETGYY
jgi:hypothetical protein